MAIDHGVTIRKREDGHYNFHIRLYDANLNPVVREIPADKALRVIRKNMGETFGQFYGRFEISARYGEKLESGERPLIKRNALLIGLRLNILRDE